MTSHAGAGAAGKSLVSHQELNIPRAPGVPAHPARTPAPGQHQPASPPPAWSAVRSAACTTSGAGGPARLSRPWLLPLPGPPCLCACQLWLRQRRSPARPQALMALHSTPGSVLNNADPPVQDKQRLQSGSSATSRRRRVASPTMAPRKRSARSSPSSRARSELPSSILSASAPPPRPCASGHEAGQSAHLHLRLPSLLQQTCQQQCAVRGTARRCPKAVQSFLFRAVLRADPTRACPPLYHLLALPRTVIFGPSTSPGRTHAASTAGGPRTCPAGLSSCRGLRTAWIQEAHDFRGGTLDEADLLGTYRPLKRVHIQAHCPSLGHHGAAAGSAS